MSATIERRFHLANQGHRRGGFHRAVRPGDESVTPPSAAPPAPPIDRVHPLARRMAMAIRCEQLIASGVASDQASLAAAAGMTRAWVTVVMRMNLLAPDIQEALLDIGPDSPVNQRAVDRIAKLNSWTDQRNMWGIVSPFE
ncbi:hypothetical protein LBMAG53_23080 [Planctomycetota bacterium]|nr:hypothetical protein LBMAG53_23080 [Planctomycetota bacterium]